MEDFEPRFLLLAGALLIGAIYGAVGRLSGFCLRSAVIEAVERRPSKQIAAWAVALPVAIAGTQWMSVAGIIDLSESIYTGSSAFWLALILGGFLFGQGMVMTRGCGGRHLVLAAGGNLRSWVVVTVLGLTAYATLRGILALPRTWVEGLGSVEFASGGQALPQVLNGATGLSSDTLALLVSAAALVIGAVTVIRLRGNGGITRGALAGAVIGLLIPLGWYVTGVLGFDDFEPTPVASITFTAPIGDAVQYLMTYTGASANFGITVVGGALVGSFIVALLFGQLRPEGFETPGQLARYALGASLMGFGGVLALGCTIGAGLSGMSTLSIGSVLALSSILTGAAVGHQFKTRLVGGREPKAVSA